MDKQELKEKYLGIYNYIISSEDEENMQALGAVAKQQMEWFIENKPEAAEEWIEQLCAVKWNNYVTRREATYIITEMNPKPLWTHSQWESEMKLADIPLENEPYYNKCALFVTMCMISSDHGPTLSKLLDVENDSLLKPIYSLAIDKLKDKDGKFRIRKYFDL